MTLRYDENRKRIICRWVEPTKIVMNKKEGLIKRTRMITVKVNDSGRLNSKDIRRHGEHPLFPHINRFNNLLNEMYYFADGEQYQCAECGRADNATPHFDTSTQSVVWLCGEHGTVSSKIASFN